MAVPIFVEPSGFVGLVDRDLQSMGFPIDSTTVALMVIDYSHHEIHSGSAFACHYDVTTAATNDHVSAIGLLTPPGSPFMHMTMRVSASNPAEAFILESPTTIVLGTGSDVAIYNRNRTSSKTSKAASIEAPAVAGGITTFNNTEYGNLTVVGGTTIDHVILAGGEGPKAVGGTHRGDEEWILKPDTFYLFRLQNIGANANLHQINLDWYEHTDR